jgi:RND superfamily putative drug exporter
MPHDDPDTRRTNVTSTFLPGNPPAGPLANLARLVLRHRRLVAGVWVLLFVAGAFGASRISDRLSVNFSLPGQPGWETAKRIDASYQRTGTSPASIIVVTAPPGRSVQADLPRISGVFARLRAMQPGLRIVDYGATHDRRLLTRDGHTTYALVFAPRTSGFGLSPRTEQATSFAARALPGYTVGQTGLQELSNQGEPSGTGVLAETLIGALGALCVLAFVFASLLALLPLLVAAVSILTTLLILLALSYLSEVSFIVQFLVSLVGLGVAIDYSLLLVTRWREERHHGRDNHDAIVAAMATAGHAVLLSGLTVTIGLLALVVLPVPGLRSVGWGGMLIPIVSVAVTLTLLPAFLGGFGGRIDWPRLRRETHASRAWTWWGRTVVQHKLAATLVGLAALAVLIVPIFDLTAGETSPDALAKTGAARQTYARLTQGGIPAGVLTPLQVLTRSGARQAVAQRLGSVPGVADVANSSSLDSNQNETSVLLAVPAAPTLNNHSLQVVRDVRQTLNSIPGAIGAAGEGPSELDYIHAVFGNAPLMLAVIAALTFILLARAFHSPVLALKAIALNLVSLAATFGLLTWFWQQGHGDHAVFGIPATGAVPYWLPLVIFAFLFGLSMDYEVLILSRMREQYLHSRSTSTAVIEGLGRTGRLVTSAALILFLAFASLASAPSTDLKILATGLGAGILLDATIVRALLLPALVATFGRWNWWYPTPLARLLLTRPSRTEAVSTSTR